jgi:hypothetical protein
MQEHAIASVRMLSQCSSGIKASKKLHAFQRSCERFCRRKYSIVSALSSAFSVHEIEWENLWVCLWLFYPKFCRTSDSVSSREIRKELSPNGPSYMKRFDPVVIFRGRKHGRRVISAPENSLILLARWRKHFHSPIYGTILRFFLFRNQCLLSWVNR